MIEFRNNGVNFAARLRAFAGKLDRVLQQRRTFIEGVMRQGIRNHFRALEMGGSVAMAKGGSVVWSRSRYSFTKRMRKRMNMAGIGPVFPILRITGRPQNAVLSGRVHITDRGVAYRVPQSIRAWTEAHQLGLSILPPSKHAGKPLPARPFIFWDPLMREQVRNTITRYFNQEKRR